MLVRLGLVKPGIQWNLKKALYGLRVAPKRWSQKRDKVLDNQPVALTSTLEADTQVDGSTHQERQLGFMKRCRTAQGLWKVIYRNEIVGFFLVYVDDVLMAAKTKWILGIVNSFGKNWECKYVGILVNDGESTELAVQTLVFLSITIELEDWFFTNMSTWRKS